MAFTIRDGVLWKYTEEQGVTDIVIPKGVTRIEAYAFEWCENLTSVIIPEGVTEIGERAFFGCKSLISVTLPEGMTRIGRSAFCGCHMLTNVTIPKSASSIEDCAFFGTPWLKKYPDDMVIINGNLLEYKGKDSVAVIPSHVTGIGDRAFFDCKSLTSVIIPEGMTTIGHYAFTRCTSLSGLTIPSSVTRIGDDPFYGCRSIRLFGITFAPKAFKEKDYTNARKMLQTRDFSMKISTDIKYAAAVGFWLKTEDEAAESFIRKSISRIMPFLIENGNADAIRKLLESGKFITKKNIDKFIGCAIGHTQNGGSIEIQTMLLHYKSEVLGYKDPAAQFKL